jgi:hypothetical protein
MKFMKDFISKIHAVRFFIVILFSAILAISISNVAIAKTVKNDPTEGTVQLNRIQQKAEDVANSAPATLEEVEERSKGGLNEVQGSSDQNKMKLSNDSQPAVADQIQTAIEKAIK